MARYVTFSLSETPEDTNLLIELDRLQKYIGGNRSGLIRACIQAGIENPGILRGRNLGRERTDYSKFELVKNEGSNEE